MSQPANDDFSQHLSDDEASYHEDASENGTATNKPKQQQQQLIPTTTTILNIKLPILKKEEYDIWAMEMEHYLEYIDNDVWKVIHNGNRVEQGNRVEGGGEGDDKELVVIGEVGGVLFGGGDGEDLLEDNIKILRRSERFRREEVIEIEKNDVHI
ncbi:hypothetical protein Tco_0655570 [Tanacetum coccineum]|uniref:Uncharacterized protein n=1 Tax=Tanacetum coccineum TaxID=301880 RepID=A0ABQ4X6I9_9ASTR